MSEERKRRKKNKGREGKKQAITDLLKVCLDVGLLVGHAISRNVRVAHDLVGDGTQELRRVLVRPLLQAHHPVRRHLAERLPFNRVQV